jgi:hypothetical protein
MRDDKPDRALITVSVSAACRVAVVCHLTLWPSAQPRIMAGDSSIRWEHDMDYFRDQLVKDRRARRIGEADAYRLTCRLREVAETRSTRRGLRSRIIALGARFSSTPQCPPPVVNDPTSSEPVRA